MIKNYKHFFILLFLSLIWGSSFILMDKAMSPFNGVLTFNDMQVAAMRIFIAFLSLSPFIFKSIKKVSKNEIYPLLIVGLFGNGIPAFLFTYSQTILESSFVGMLNSMTPIFTWLIGFYFFRQRSSILNFLGILFGFIGVVFLYLTHDIRNISLNNGLLIVLSATICYAISINVIRHYLSGLDALSIAVVSFLFIGPISGLYLFSTDIISIIRTEPGIFSLGYIIILSTICTSFAIVIFNKLVKDTSAFFAASVTYVIPIIAIFWGLLDNEKITSFHITGIGIILIGVYLVNKSNT